MCRLKRVGANKTVSRKYLFNWFKLLFWNTLWTFEINVEQAAIWMKYYQVEWNDFLLNTSGVYNSILRWIYTVDALYYSNSLSQKEVVREQNSGRIRNLFFLIRVYVPEFFHSCRFERVFTLKLYNFETDIHWPLPMPLVLVLFLVILFQSNKNTIHRGMSLNNFSRTNYAEFAG